MKSEAEIRAHRDALRTCIDLPCQCRQTGHAFECMVGREMMAASIATLNWVLGEAEDLQDMVDFMALGASTTGGQGANP